MSMFNIIIICGIIFSILATMVLTMWGTKWMRFDEFWVYSICFLALCVLLTVCVANSYSSKDSKSESVKFGEKCESEGYEAFNYSSNTDERSAVSPSNVADISKLGTGVRDNGKGLSSKVTSDESVNYISMDIHDNDTVNLYTSDYTEN